MTTTAEIREAFAGISNTIGQAVTAAKDSDDPFTTLGAHLDQIRGFIDAMSVTFTLEPEPSALGCKGCLLGRAQAVAKGVPEAELPAINRAEFIIGGDSYGRCHINLVDGPIVPGRTASGLIVGNGQQLPPMNGHGH